MNYKKTEIKRGIKIHTIKTDKFKTNLIAIFLTNELTRENVTKNALIPTILKRGSMTMNNQEEISRQMEEMYGAYFDCGLDKTGDNQILKFYIDEISEEYIPEKSENLLKKSIDKMLDIILNPYLENGGFKEEYVEQEKINMKQRIEGKVDNKARYALDRCIEEMYKDKPFGLYKFGYIEDFDKINGKNLYEYYKEMINTCKIDIYVSGNFNEDVEKIINENERIKELKERTPKYIIPKADKKEKIEIQNEVIEKMDVTQGKLVIGLDVDLEGEKGKYTTLVYNSILGGSANSKLFQNVREKEHLAYVASSSYLRNKNNIFINCGIEIENYDKTVSLIKEQLESIKKGEFSIEDIENNKEGIIENIKTIKDEQDTQITYSFGQELTNSRVSLEEYEKNVREVTKEDIIDIANKVEINTIYFLKN